MARRETPGEHENIVGVLTVMGGSGPAEPPCQKKVTAKQGNTAPTTNRHNAALQGMILRDKMAGLSIGDYLNL